MHAACHPASRTWHRDPGHEVVALPAVFDRRENHQQRPAEKTAGPRVRTRITAIHHARRRNNPISVAIACQLQLKTAHGRKFRLTTGGKPADRRRQTPLTVGGSPFPPGRCPGPSMVCMREKSASGAAGPRRSAVCNSFRGTQHWLRHRSTLVPRDASLWQRSLGGRPGHRLGEVREGIHAVAACTAPSQLHEHAWNPDCRL